MTSNPRRRQQNALRITRHALRRIVESATPGSSEGLHVLLPAAAGAAIILVVLLIAVFWLIVTILSGFRVPDQKMIPPLLTAAISMTALVGASLGAVYAFRKQVLAERDGIRADQQVYSDRFIKAAELLASENAAARLAAVHALAALADDWTAGRNACAMAICSYLRFPPPDRHDGQVDSGEREVRRTAWEAIRHRLQDPESPMSWHDQQLDFSGGQFDSVDLDRIALDGVSINFTGCTFVDGELRLRGCKLRNCAVDFTGTSFRNMKVSLTGLNLGEKSAVSWDKAEIYNSVYELDHMTLTANGGLWIRGARVSKTKFQFNAHDATYHFQRSSSTIEGDVDFSDSELDDVSIPMSAYELKGRLVFSGTTTNLTDIYLPLKMRKPYVNLDVAPKGPTKIYVGPGRIEGGNLRIRPRGEALDMLEVNFADFDVAGGELLVSAMRPVWRSFKLDLATEPKGRIKIWGSFPSNAEIEIDRRATPPVDE